MESTAFRRLGVGRVAGVKLESDFLGMVLFFSFYIGWFRLIDSSLVVLAEHAGVVPRRIGRMRGV